MERQRKLRYQTRTAGADFVPVRHGQAPAALLYAEVERALGLDLDHRVLGPG